MNKKQLKWWFGQKYQIKDNLIYFQHLLDSENIIIVVDELNTIKQKYVMLTDNNKGCFLKNNSVLGIIQANHKPGYLVRLSRNEFDNGLYTFNFDFKNTNMIKETTFDDLVQIAKLQDHVNEPIILPPDY